jgi:hypothetical protein
MLDATLVLSDVEEMLDEHYNEIHEEMQRRVRVYETSPQTPAAKQLPARAQSNNALNELVANVFVLFMLSVLNNGLTKQPTR